ncbi:hypothetical protein ACE38W_06870 [Chitinophaga sp. Hz27]|uniref:hypothetical protein n=1 Tax=Chitinophaga sp. Hz27 TaxID=3347169 RepID=UPI0035D6AC40
MNIHITPDIVARVNKKYEMEKRNRKTVTFEEPLEISVQWSTGLLELQEYLSVEENADDFAFSGWCAAQRGAWQKQRDLERAEMKREKESAKRIDT